MQRMCFKIKEKKKQSRATKMHKNAAAICIAHNQRNLWQLNSPAQQGYAIGAK